MEYPVSQNRKITFRDLRWLGIALVAHALLLLIPLRDHLRGPGDEQAAITVRLFHAFQDQPEPPATEEQTPSPEPELLEIPPESPPEIREPMQEEIAENALPVEDADEHPPISIAKLLGLRESIGERVPLEDTDGDATLSLGEPAPFERPYNWQHGAGARALGPFDNTFNGKTVPAKVEVVDRWLAADGSHNVIVETPTGLRMCGRARSWNPIQPLVEHIMMWQVCGGDGKSGFRFKPREPLDRNFIIPVAKDATEP